VRCIRNFLYSLRSEYLSYSLHIRIFRYICKHHLFASFASYSLQNIRPNSHTNIQFDATQIHFGEYLNQNIRFEANIRNYLSEFHIEANIHLKTFAYKRIFACEYSHTSEFSLRIASSHKGKPFTILDSINNRFFEIFTSFCFKIFALKQNK
jgi:hypothetical protein